VSGSHIPDDIGLALVAGALGRAGQLGDAFAEELERRTSDRKSDRWAGVLAGALIGVPLVLIVWQFRT